MSPKKDLSIDFCGVHFENPVMLSSSPVSNSAEMVSRAFEAGFGGVAFKTIGLDATKIIHPSPRMAPYHCGPEPLVGLQNVEQISDRPTADNFADLAYLKRTWPDRVIISSIMGFSKADWAELAKRSEDAGVDMLELNFSCPHMTVEGSGMKVSQAHELVAEFTEAVRSATGLPILAKLTPNITDITEPARFAKQGGADGFAAINTVSALTGVDLDSHVGQPNVFGKSALSGFSGPAVKPIGLRCVAELGGAADLGLPISGMGGIETWVDAVEYLLCGAATLQITTGVIHYGYRIVEDILEGLSDHLEAQGLEGVADLVGLALPNITATEDFELGRQGVAVYDLDRCVGCGQCHVVCYDAGGQCLSWDGDGRRPVLDESRCLSCMICSFVCPVKSPPLITYKEVENKPEIMPPVMG